jgi:hypothetical protein
MPILASLGMKVVAETDCTTTFSPLASLNTNARDSFCCGLSEAISHKRRKKAIMAVTKSA